jgi:serine/threonine protein phosphatase PrpC
MTQYVLDVAALSDAGIKRERNEDSWSGPPPDLTPEQKATKGQLYVVADGVGGHLAGEQASALATETIQRHYYANPTLDAAACLPAAIHAANERIQHDADATLSRLGMSTTTTAAVLRDDELTVANVGDSRTYLIRQEHARQVTVDHSWVEEQVQFGLITREEAAHHPHRNIITRSLGSTPELQIDIFEERVRPGDSVLLCSDGLSNMVSDQEISEIVSQNKSAEVIVQELVELSKQRGAPDNVTAVLLKIGPARGCRGQTSIAGGILIGLILLMMGVLALWILTQKRKE